MKRLFALLLTVFFLLPLVACQKETENAPTINESPVEVDERPSFYAKVSRIQEDSIWVQPQKDEPEYKTSENIQIFLGNKTDEWYSPGMGETVRIFYDGKILYNSKKSYKITAVEDIEFVAEAEPIPQRDPIVGVEVPKESSAHKLYDVTVTFGYYTDSNKINRNALNAPKVKPEEARQIPLYRLDTLSDLQSFKEEFVGDQTDGHIIKESAFSNATEKYNEEFFSENSLLLVYFTAGSGSPRFGVHSVEIADGKLYVHIEKTMSPMIQDCALAGWVITLVIPDSTAESCTEFDVDYISN